MFDIRGPRGALTAEHARELVADILAGKSTAFTSAILSSWAFDEAAAEVIAEGLAALPALVDVDMSDIIAGREEAIGLRVYEVLSAVLKNKRLQGLDLSDNALGPKGVAACREMLERQEDLERLSLCRNGVSAEALHTIADLLLYRGEGEPTKLTKLHLFNNMCGGEGAKAAASILRCSPNLQDFRFSSCRGTEDGGVALASSLKSTTSLRKLELSDNMFDPRTGEALAATLPQQKQLCHLDLSDIGLGDEGVASVCEAIVGHCTRIEVLSFAASELTDDGVAPICALIRQLPCLRVLCLEDNDELGNPGARRLARCLAASAPSLERLNVSGTAIRTSAFVALLNALTPKSSFTALQVADLIISPAAVSEAEGRSPGVVQGYEEDAYETDASDDEGGDTDDDADAASPSGPDAEVDALAADIAAATISE